jgi:hypothetical protein
VARNGGATNLRRTVAAIAAGMLAVLPWAPAAGAQAPQAAPGYEELVARAKAGDASVDWLALRNAYAESPNYDPYGATLRQLRSEMLDAHRRGDCAAAIAKAEDVLAANFVDIDAHLLASLCHEQLGNEQAMRREHAAARDLLGSILKSGDGKSEQTAFVVVQIAEEYSILRLLRLEPANQALIQAQGHNYDRFEAKSRDTGREAMVYFNIDRLLAALDRELHPERK